MTLCSGGVCSGAEMDPTIVFRDDRLCAATWGAVFFEIWSAAATPAHFKLLCDHQVSYARAQPGQRIALFTIVQMASIPALDRATRREVDERSRRMAPHGLAAVVVLPNKGFGAAIVRSVLAASALLRRPDYPSKVCPTVDEGCSWVVQHLPPMDGRPVAVHDLRRACEAARVPSRVDAA